MIEQFSIFTTGGTVLWSRDLDSGMDMSGVNSLVREVFLGERAGETSYQFVYEASKYLLKWSFVNELGLIFVAVYPAILNNKSLLLIENVLRAVQDRFSALWKKQNKGSSFAREFCIQFEFDTVYDAIVERFENASIKGTQRKQRSFKDTKKGQEKKKLNATELKKEEKKRIKAEEKAKAMSKEEERLARIEKKFGRKPGAFKKKKKPIKPVSTTQAKKKRNWNNELTEEEKLELDATGGNVEEDIEEAERLRLEEYKKTFIGDGIKFDDDELDDLKDVGEEKEEKKSSGFFSFFKSLTGQKPLTEEDLKPILDTMRNRLLDKNVAVDIAEKICESVCTALVGRVVGTFGSARTMVREAVEKALTRILTPKRVIDILPEILAARRKGKPYVIVFIGVNGVGKSTSLAKVAAYLRSKGLSVSLAACDTFRSGAVEQLRTHARCLNIRVFERGYNRDAAGVASDAIAQAAMVKDDVVLVDTAGRMQDNSPLMRALAKLVAVNNPNLVLFVGEALVGNDAVDQVTRFNQALSEYSTAKNPRLIDGMILTKFDTIDDKVGAAISLTYVTGKPIVFVGTGQTYSDLKRMNVKMLIRMLLR
mmetsp:Transcript_5588/g.8245  ORF Transcript_5588/g.8245 Transcript_5588/m.8245 type:complete len:595 (+) Transcript_5588:53-1837(+)|eukprot:CAMPEP_0167755340 /NCGR_PEP_ID=MMETSP0110_2-20121227/8767_1 /TAXON_ID=629695 /ORGANISM="Gymnochlora sp., Strain CCMP2014" /LENGTH=594 /DNA_ID=CAMNT_0007641311 /DNA_START=45 /DNA_END=1829 /DNA_ORIENTATION=-